MFTTASFVEIKYPKGTVQTKSQFHQCTTHHCQSGLWRQFLILIQALVSMASTGRVVHVQNFKYE